MILHAETVVQIRRVSTDSRLIVMQGIRTSPQLFSVASIDEKIRSSIPRKLNNLRLQLLKNEEKNAPMVSYVKNF